MKREQLSTDDLAGAGAYDSPPGTERIENRAAFERERNDLDAARDRSDLARDRADVARERVDDPRGAVVADAPRVTPIDSRHDAVAASAAARDASGELQLFDDGETSALRRRWSDIQAGFVDEPRKAVELADSLVAETMQRLAQTFASARQSLEHQWDRGEDVTTEDLRVTLQRYRSFFDRLLSV